MKTLPDFPNLDHLRRQAKDLLAGLRDSRPEATLADAQASLAEQYGFRTWTDLKAEVDRLRERGEVASGGLAQAVADRFGLGSVTGPMRSVAPADENGRRWSLETERGRWAVRTMDTWRPIVDAETDVALQEAAMAAGVLLPPPVRSVSGAVVESIDGHPWRAYGWIHSGPPLAAPVSASIARQVGAILARVHRLGLPEPDRISPYHTQRPSEEDWRRLEAAARAKGVAWAPLLREAFPNLRDLAAIGEAGRPPAPVLTHNVLGPAKVRVGGGGRLIVVGWEHAGGQPSGWELSDALLHWTGGLAERVNGAGAQALLDGYRAEAGSLPVLDLTTFRGSISGFLNYTFGQVEVALGDLDAEERRFADRNLGHLLTHLPTRAHLERLLNAAFAPAR